MDDLHILIADDDSEWTSRCKKMLASSSITVLTEISVESAIDTIRQDLYDLILCDIKMSYIDRSGIKKDDGGFKIAQYAIGLIPNVKVVMVTAYGSSSVTRQSFKEGAFDYIEKSMSGTKEDVKKIKKIIDKIIQERDASQIAPNPFVIDEGKLPNLFVDRNTHQTSYNSFVKKTFDTLAKHHSSLPFLIIGDDGSGKTCSLKHFKNYVQKQNCIASYFNVADIKGCSSKQLFVSSLLVGILKGFSKYDVSHFQSFIKRFTSLGIKIGIITATVNLTKTPGNEMPASSTLLREGLEDIYNDLKDFSEVIAIFIDNAHNFLDDDILETLLNVLISPPLANLGILVGLSYNHEIWNKRVRTSERHVSYRSFLKNKFELSNFTQEEVYELIANTLFNSGVTFSPEVINKVYTLTLGKPFETQLFCHNLYENQIGGKVDIDVFEKARNKTLEDIANFRFKFMYELCDDEWTILRILALSVESLTRDDIDHKLIDMKKKKLIIKSEKIIDQLYQKNIISLTKKNDIKDDNYFIKNPMFQEYIIISRSRDERDISTRD